MDRSLKIQGEKETIEAEAAEWVIRLGDERLSARDRVAFDNWRARSSAHQKAYDLAAQTWIDLAGLSNAEELLRPETPAASPHTIGHMPAMHPVRPVRKHGFRAVSLAICLCLAGGLATFWYGNPVTMLAADYRTAPGEIRTVSLPDGTKVDLSSGTAIALAFDGNERRVRLLEGAAYFTAAPAGSAEPRPFVVEVDDGSATALGTRFAVSRMADDIEVAVDEHDVRVSLDNSNRPPASVIVSPGQSVRYSNASGLGNVRQTTAGQTAAWRRGRLIFDRVPLADIVAELNRYRRGRIMISNDALARRTVSGVFSTDNLEDSLSVIVGELGARSASISSLLTVIY